MWKRRRDRTGVTCIACGEQVARADAREYDKYGDRWDREDKTFEYLCKPCFRDLCHQSRPGLEETLEAVDTGGLSQARFLARFAELIADPRDSPEFESDPPE